MQKHFKESLMPAMSLLVRIVVALSVTISFTVVAGDCPGAGRNMTIEAACREVCGALAAPAPARGMYQLCVDTLREEDTPAWSVVEEAGEYAQRAAWRAMWAYLDTMGRAWHFIAGNTTAAPAGGEEERAAYASCVGGRYQEAEAALDKVRSRLPDHCGPDVAGEYKRALRDVEACRDRVAKLKPPPPLLAMVEADYNRTLLAYLLGKLIGVK